ncbi:HLA class I histocompatibility antigen, alpha chain F-like, partial [Pseudonaja textilis]|uniref:HLA class I histocompatibility antigen, alpha chain F-like n=1 Tax=Pseudonaja textilis TaxID=8673 RepID=UPI000EA97751
LKSFNAPILEAPRGSEEEKEQRERMAKGGLACHLSHLDRNPRKPGYSGVASSAEPPVGKVTHKMVNDSLEILTCQAFGFYPKEIQAIWTRDGEACKDETLLRNVASNSDGTYYIWLSIDIDPKERDRFRCHLEQEGLQEPLDLAFKEEGAPTRWALVGVLAAVILGAGLFFLI